MEASASTHERCLIELTSFKGIITGGIYNVLNPYESPKSQIEKLCAKKTKCKTLWIRGHFGGEFFNENYSQKLSLEDLESLSCRNDCREFFSTIEEVHLLGCNTLSNGNRDLRTDEEYLNILRRHGLSSTEAASYSAQRYGLIGKSFKERFQQIFSNTEKISGFKGKTSAREIDLYLKKGKKTSNFLTTSGINKINSDEADLEISNKILTCQLRDSENTDSHIKSDLIQELISNGTFFREFDVIKNFLKNNPSWIPNEISFTQEILERKNNLLSDEHPLSFTSQILYVFKRLGLISLEELNQKAAHLLSKSLLKTFSPESRDAVCDPLFKWPTTFLVTLVPNKNFSTDPWRMRALGCLKNIPKNWIDFIIRDGTTSISSQIRVEAYRALGLINSESQDVLQALEKGLNDLSPDVRKEARYGLDQKRF